MTSQRPGGPGRENSDKAFFKAHRDMDREDREAGRSRQELRPDPRALLAGFAERDRRTGNSLREGWPRRG